MGGPKLKQNRNMNKMMELERQKLLKEKRRRDEKDRYWKQMLHQEPRQKRDLVQTYEDLYEYSRISTENELKSLKEYYYANP